jgi:hypothetical protein
VPQFCDLLDHLKFAVPRLEEGLRRRQTRFGLLSLFFKPSRIGDVQRHAGPADGSVIHARGSGGVAQPTHAPRARQQAEIDRVRLHARSRALQSFAPMLRVVGRNGGREKLLEVHCFLRRLDRFRLHR